MKEQTFLTFDLRFNLRQSKENKPTIIYAVFSYKGKQCKINTKAKVYPSQWSSKRQLAIISNGQTKLDNENNKIANAIIKRISIVFEEQKYYLCNNIEDINNIFNIMKKAINPQYQNHMSKKNEPLATEIMKQFALEKGKSANGYKGIVNKFAEFLKAKNIENSFDNMNLKTFKAYQEYLCTEDVKMVKTIRDKISALRTLLEEISESEEYNFNFDDSKLRNLKLIKDKRNPTDKRSKQVDLTETQIMDIYNLENLKPIEKEYRNLFVLQCWTGQRVSDILKLFDNENYIDENTISFANKKTKTDVCIKLDIKGYYIKDILENGKNGFKFIDLEKLGKALDEDDSNEESNKEFKKMVITYNKTIKKLGEKANLNHTIEYVEQLGNKLLNKKELFYNLMHSHSARHSFITNMLRRGEDKEWIKIVTGHTNDKMIEDIYQHLTKEDKIKKLHQTMKSNESDENKQTLPRPQIEVIETTYKNKTDNDYINSIDEAKEVLCFLGVDAEDYIGVYDFTKLLVMVGRQEAVLMDKIGFETTVKFKEIFNEHADLRERKKMLHELAISIHG